MFWQSSIRFFLQPTFLHFELETLLEVFQVPVFLAFFALPHSIQLHEFTEKLLPNDTSNLEISRLPF